MLTVLCDAAFNHRTSTDIEGEYDRLRDLARAEAEKRNDCFQRVGPLPPPPSQPHEN